MRSSSILAAAATAACLAASAAPAFADTVTGGGRNGATNANEYLIGASGDGTAATGLIAFMGPQSGQPLALSLLTGPPTCVKVEGNVANIVWTFAPLSGPVGPYIGNLIKAQDNGNGLLTAVDYLNNADLTPTKYATELARCQSAAPPLAPTARTILGDIQMQDQD